MNEHSRLLTQYLNGDKKSMAKIIEEYKDDLYNLCFKMTFSRYEADDLFQQTWEKAIKNSAKFSGKSYKNWLYTICINTYRDVARRNMRLKKLGGIDFKKENEKEIAMSVASDGISAEDLAAKKQTQATLVSLINVLPPKQKSVIVLHYFEGLSYEETAKVLNIPQGTVKSRLNTAKKKLKEQLAQAAKYDSSVREDELYVEYT